jgi:hypothetical protein
MLDHVGIDPRIGSWCAFVHTIVVPGRYVFYAESETHVLRVSKDSDCRSISKLWPGCMSVADSDKKGPFDGYVRSERHLVGKHSLGLGPLIHRAGLLGSASVMVLGQLFVTYLWTTLTVTMLARALVYRVPKYRPDMGHEDSRSDRSFSVLPKHTITTEL